MPYVIQAPDKHSGAFPFFTAIAVLLAFSFAIARGQVEMQAPPPPVDLPDLYLEAINFSTGSQDTSRLDVYVNVPYQKLSFTKNADVFHASYEATMDLYDSAGTLLTERLWTGDIETRNYTESISKSSGKVSQHSFFLKPGPYGISVQIRDSETKKVARAQRKVIVRRFEKSGLSLSDIMLVSEMNQDAGKTVIVPNVTHQLGQSAAGVTVFFEAYNPLSPDTGTFYLQVLNGKGESVGRDTLGKRLAQGRTSCFMSFKNEKLSPGDYRIEVKGKRTLRPGVMDSSATVSHTFTMRWKGLPAPITDLDNAIDELQYISDKETMEKMKKADPDTKREMFLDFWRKRNTSSNPDFNPLMEEYYQRIEYANKNFSHYVVGWKTDRGMVYVIFGEPNNVERRPFEIDAKPYEVWTYYEQNREFVFVDETGFGDYRLTSPMWDVYNNRIH